MARLPDALVTAAFVTGAALAPGGAEAQVAVSANDNKVLNVNGTVKVVPNPPADAVAAIDLKAIPPRVIAEVQAPVSVVGPPLSIAVTPDESLALVTASNKADPSDPTKQAADNRLSVIDLKANPPRVVATLQAGLGCGRGLHQPAGHAGLRLQHRRRHRVRLHRPGQDSDAGGDGGGRRAEGRRGYGGDRAGRQDGARLAQPRQRGVGPRHRRRQGRVHEAGHDGGRAPHRARHRIERRLRRRRQPGRRHQRRPRRISLIDLTAKPPRVVDTIGVLGSTAEGLKISPDRSVVAVVVHNGSNRAKESPFYNDAGKLLLVRVAGKTLSRVAEAPIGHWSQGAAFAPDGKTILVGNMIEKDYWIFQWDGATLRDTGQRLKMNGGPVAIRTAER